MGTLKDFPIRKNVSVLKIMVYMRLNQTNNFFRRCEMNKQLSSFNQPKQVLEKTDRVYGWIYLCPTCKQFVCGGSKCLECGQEIVWPKTRFETLLNK